MFHNMPFILLAVIVSAFFAGGYLPVEAQSILFGASLSIKSFIVFVLPFIIFGLLFRTSVTLASKASKTILIIVGCVCLSNLFSTMVSYSVGTFVYTFDASIAFPQGIDTLSPMFELSFPKWIENSHAMFSGLFFGIALGWLSPQLAMTVSDKIYSAVNLLLKLILVLIPFLVGGFVIKMNYDQVMTYIIQNYALIFIVVALAVYSYIAIIYLFLSQFNFANTMDRLKNLLPAAIAGFGSMSSAAAMPLTILGVEKNSKNPDLARSIVPATVNIHLVGDCFAIPIFAFAVMKSFGIEEPSLLNYLIFAGYFVLAKFSVAAVPGGGILVMLPILEAYLGFNAEMLSLITALYILFDPVITCANIFGNGGLALMIEKLTTPKLSDVASTPCKH